MKLAILPDNKCYKSLATNADIIAIRRTSQTCEEFDGKIVLFDQFYSREEAETLNHQAVRDCFDLECAGRETFSYKGISIVDIDIRQCWSKAFVQIYREVLCILSCIRELKVNTIIIEKADPWSFLFSNVTDQIGINLEFTNSFGVEDTSVSILLHKEFPSMVTIDFHRMRKTEWKTSFYILMVNMISSIVRMFKGKKKSFLFSMYKPLEPLRRDLLCSKEYYSILHQIGQVSFWDMVCHGAKLFCFKYVGCNAKALEMAKKYKTFLSHFLSNRYFISMDNMKVCVDKMLLYIIKDSMPSAFCQIIANIDLLDDIFRFGCINGYFGFCDSPWEERLIVRMCQKYNVPDAIIINGVLSNSFYMEAKTADHVLVYGESQKKNYLKDYPEKAVVSGNPLYEMAFSRRSSKITYYPPRKILVGTSDPVPGDINCHYSSTERFLHDVMDIVDSLKVEYNYEVFLKLHPGESSAFYEWLVKKEGFKIDGIINSGDMQEIMMDFDLLIINHSVAVIEASLIGIPVLYYHPAKQVMFEPFNGQGGLISAFDKAELGKAFGRIFKDREYAFQFTKKEVLEPFCASFDANTNKFAGLIFNELLGAKQ